MIPTEPFVSLLSKRIRKEKKPEIKVALSKKKKEKPKKTKQIKKKRTSVHDVVTVTSNPLSSVGNSSLSSVNEELKRLKMNEVNMRNRMIEIENCLGGGTNHLLAGGMNLF